MVSEPCSTCGRVANALATTSDPPAGSWAAVIGLGVIGGIMIGAAYMVSKLQK